jgi:hypothetical protein
MDLSFSLSTVIALLALVLSQLPPLKYLLRGRRLRITVPELFSLSHLLGNVNIAIFLDLHNDGGSDITIARVDCLLTNSEGLRLDLPAWTYFSRQTPPPGQSQTELWFGRISLKPEGHWAETIRCFKLWSEDEQEKTNEIISKIREDINSKLPSLPPKTLAHADNSLVEAARAFFEKKFPLSKGNYCMFIAALSDSDQVLAVRGFDLTLFESSIRSLRAHADDYKIGAGVYYPNADQSKMVFPRLRPIADEEARVAYSKLRATMPSGH